MPTSALAEPTSTVVKTPHVEVSLVTEHTSVQPGGSVRLGLAIRHAPEWHTYWVNPGDAGYPPRVDWKLPAGSRVSGFDWPAPKRLAVGPVINYVFEGETLLPATLTAPASAQPGSMLEIKGQAEWLVCKDVCIPEEGELSLRLPVSDTAGGPSAHAARFADADRLRPRAVPGWGPARLEASENDLLLTFAGPPGQALDGFDLFAETEQLVEPTPLSAHRTASGYAVRLKRVEGATLPAALSFVVTAREPFKSSGEGSPAPALRLLAPVVTVSSLAPAAGAQPIQSPLLRTPSTTEAMPKDAPLGATAETGGLTLLPALVLALVGGMILNLMPCVFPVLSLKILSFAQHHGQAEGGRAMRKHGLYYAAGVVASFLALAGILLALKAAGNAIGWGFQLQEPAVVWGLAAIFFLIGLNLMGAFEVGQLAPSSVLSFTAKHPGVDAFATGVLAVVAASPCTAPFMGAALGFALTQSAATALVVFAALGFGMALPYVALAWFPAWLDRLPRPGPWMVSLKQALAFPMFLAVVWLLWVLAQQVDVDRTAAALLGLVGLAFGAWLIGSRRPLVRWSGVAAALAAVALAWPSTARAPQVAGEPAAQPRLTDGAVWAPWSPEAVEKALAEGKPV
ncbi:MAG: protein-disulfide reductase DsbD family protein, partial [Casimicrobiaceae bacterium]